MQIKLLIDNNVILDVFQSRVPFVSASSRVLLLVEEKRVKGYITANSVTDIHYMLKKYLKDPQKLYSIMEVLLKIVEVIDVTGNDIKEALRPDVVDFEDELICVCAGRWEMSYIITRNKKDFVNCMIESLTPEEFLKEHQQEISH